MSRSAEFQPPRWYGRVLAAVGGLGAWKEAVKKDLIR